MPFTVGQRVITMSGCNSRRLTGVITRINRREKTCRVYLDILGVVERPLTQISDLPLMERGLRICNAR
jgi:hypothetical protein